MQGYPVLRMRIGSFSCAAISAWCYSSLEYKMVLRIKWPLHMCIIIWIHSGAPLISTKRRGWWVHVSRLETRNKHPTPCTGKDDFKKPVTFRNNASISPIPYWSHDIWRNNEHVRHRSDNHLDTMVNSAIGCVIPSCSWQQVKIQCTLKSPNAEPSCKPEV